MYKFGKVPNLCAQIWQCAKFVHFYRDEEKKCTNLAPCQICALKFGTLPNLCAQFWHFARFVRGPLQNNYNLPWNCFPLSNIGNMQENDDLELGYYCVQLIHPTKLVTGAFTHMHIHPRRFHSHCFQPLYFRQVRSPPAGVRSWVCGVRPPQGLENGLWCPPPAGARLNHRWLKAMRVKATWVNVHMGETPWNQFLL